MLNDRCDVEEEKLSHEILFMITFQSSFQEMILQKTHGHKYVCACMLSNYSEWPYTVPDFVGNNCFCATGHNQYYSSHDVVLLHNFLWDDEGCTGSNTCCQFNQPPWFYRILPAATTDDLEVRICASSQTICGNTFLSHIELYVK